MNIKNFKFADSLNNARFGDVPKILLKEAETRGMCDHRATPYNRLFNNLFFKGGPLHIKDNLDEDFKNEVIKFLKATMGSFGSKHEHKEAVCALLLSELVDITRYTEEYTK